MHRHDDLLAARNAFARGDWRACYEGFSRVQAAATPATGETLTTDDLSALGLAAWRIGRGREANEIAEQIYHRLVADGEARRAAMKAIELGLQWINSYDLTIARAWMNRARRILGTVPEDPAHGYLMYLDSVVAEIDNDYDVASYWADRLQDLGRRFSSPALTALGLTAGGLAAIGSARMSEGWAQLDEAMLPVLAGQVPLDWAGDIYCAVIEYCHRLCDLNRMREWITAMDRWRESPAVGATTYGRVCDVYRVQLLSATNSYVDVAKRLVITSSELEDINIAAAAEGYYELGEVRRRMGDIDGARTAFERARELGCDPQPGSALLRCQLGEHAAAWTELRMRLEAENDLGSVRMLRAAVEITLAADSVDDADSLCSRLDERAKSFDTPGFRAWALHCRGAVAIRQGRPADALAALQEALRHYRNLKCRYEVAQVYEWMSLAHNAVGDFATAADHGAAAEAIYQELGAEPTPWCSPGTAMPGGLTKREIEVLSGIAGGATNREVAERLSISEKTVGRHLANIYAKLGVSSRTAAVAWAHDNNALRGA